MDQAPSTSQQKRKYAEYHDPDYPSEVADSYDGVGSKCPKLSDATKSLPFDKTTKPDPNIDEGAKIKRRQTLCNIISREFDTEIALKKTQLEQIDKRLDEAVNIFHKLRYSIVSEYYRKQEVPLNKPAADAIRGGSQSLFSYESAGPQLPLHPSLKKIIGKKPKSYEDLLRTKPERSAAVQAKLEIRARNPAQKRHERRMQKLIRQQGIVIDHSKEEDENTTSANMNFKPQDGINHVDDDQPSTSKQALLKEKAAAAAALTTSSTTLMANPIQIATTTTTANSGKLLNTSRLNNKTKFLFVIGNTSKYIGAGPEANSSGNSQVLSHKWLVYVQGKDMQKPVETFLKKVRFHLHHSYRPNDVVDVCHPPFQIARRGWGEFPMRIQLYFHEDFHQKPVQLLHHLILDKTLSGLHTLGAETIVEVWLRIAFAKIEQTNSSSSPITSSCAINNNKQPNTPPKLPSPIIESNKPRTISITHNKEELDDTLFGFLNKIEISPDIEKIQPTVVVPEQLECILSTSPIKPMPDNSTNIQQQQIQMATPVAAVINTAASLQLQQQHTAITAAQAPLPPPTNQVKVSNLNVPIPLTFDNVNPPVRTMPMKPIVPKLTTTASATKPAVVYLPKTSNVSPPLRNNNKINNSNLLVIKDKKFIVTNVKNLKLMSNGSSSPSNSNKKLVRFVDVQGRVKIVPMLLSQPLLQVPKQNTNVTENVGNQLRASQTSLIPLKPDIQKAVSVKPSVFQKEGKLYIIDPQQIKLKQTQKKQQSLLKPQQSLLKQNQTLDQLELASRLHSIASDHDYAPAPISVMLRKPPALQILPDATSSNMKVPSIKPPKLEPCIDTTSDNNRLIIHRQRLELERQFQRVNFQCMREATEFLLRRVPIVAEQGTPAATFSYVSHSLREFEMLDGLKQRAIEWVRAKVVKRYLRNHQRLKDFETSNKESYWSMREIIMFARYHAYTPIIKPIYELHNAFGNNPKLNQKTPFAALVQSEIKQEKQQIQYETLTSNSRLRTWVDLNIQRLQHFECKLMDNQIIDVHSLDEIAKNPSDKSNLLHSQLKPEEITSNGTNQLYLPLPTHLSNAAQLVGDFCKSSGTQLETTEELTPGVIHTSALTVLTHTLQLFVEKLLRRSIAAKVEQQQSNNENGIDTLLLGTPSDLVISPQDIGRVIAQFTEYDFLTNSHLGTPTNSDEVNP